jgi:hypothetical protein
MKEQKTKMVPLKFCGLYTIIASTNPMYIGTKINIDYNHIRVSLVKKVGPIIINKNIYGSMFIKENTNSVKIQWLNSGNYEIDLSWSEGKVKTVKIRSATQSSAKVLMNGKIEIIKTTK